MYENRRWESHIKSRSDLRYVSRRKAVWDTDPQHPTKKLISADVAQLVERILGKNEVSGPIPDVGSTKNPAFAGFFIF